MSYYTKTFFSAAARGNLPAPLIKIMQTDKLLVAGDVIADIFLLEAPRNFLAVMQGSVVKSGRCADP